MPLQSSIWTEAVDEDVVHTFITKTYIAFENDMTDFFSNGWLLCTHCLIYYTDKE